MLNEPWFEQICQGKRGVSVCSSRYDHQVMVHHGIQFLTWEDGSEEDSVGFRTRTPRAVSMSACAPYEQGLVMLAACA